MRKLAIGTSVWLLFDLWRVWTPSLITIFGQAASTPAEAIGAFAIGCMALPLVLIALGGGAWRGRGVLPGLLGLALVARTVLGAGTSGDAQLYVAAAGMVCAATFLCLATARFGGDLVDGVLLGVALAATTQGALGGLHAVWRQDVWGWLEIAALAACTLVAARALWSDPGDDVAIPRALAWLVFPALLVCGMTLANVGWASAASGAWGPVAVVVGCWLALAVPQVRQRWVAALVLVLAVGACSLVTTSEGATPAWAGLLPVVGMPALAIVLGGLAHVRPRVGAIRPTAAAATGAIIWVLLLFGFYAGYDMGYTAPWIPLAVTLVIAAIGLVAGGRTERVPMLRSGRAVAAVAVAGLIAGLASLVTLTGPATGSGTPGQTLTVMAYNVRMGFGLDGRFNARAVADLIKEQGADVVMLSEVDRAWLLNGGQDQLRILATLTGTHAAFGPAGDQVWGDAILSRLPLKSVARHRFEPYGSNTGAQALLATVSWRGQSLRVISTHLQPTGDELDKTTGQAAELAELMATAAQEYDAVIAGGDLNTTPGSAAWQTLLDTGFSDALAASRPLPTNPAEKPVDEIDHLFSIGSLTPREPRTVERRSSDHLPVLVDLATPG